MHISKPSAEVLNGLTDFLTGRSQQKNWIWIWRYTAQDLTWVQRTGAPQGCSAMSQRQGVLKHLNSWVPTSLHWVAGSRHRLSVDIISGLFASGLSLYAVMIEPRCSRACVVCVLNQVILEFHTLHNVKHHDQPYLCRDGRVFPSRSFSVCCPPYCSTYFICLHCCIWWTRFPPWTCRSLSMVDSFKSIIWLWSSLSCLL